MKLEIHLKKTPTDNTSKPGQKKIISKNKSISINK